MKRINIRPLSLLITIFLSIGISQGKLQVQSSVSVNSNEKLIIQSDGVCIVENTKITKGVKRFSTAKNIVSAFNMEKKSIGIISHVKSFTYQFTNIDSDFKILSTFDFEIIRDLGFPQIHRGANNQYLFLNPVEQIVTIYNDRGDQIVQKSLFDNNDFDHEKRLFFIQGTENDYDLILAQEEATGNKNSSYLFALTKNVQFSSVIPIQLSLPYHGILTQNNVLGVTGTSFTNTYQDAIHKILLYDLTSNSLIKNIEVPSPPKIFTKGTNQIYSVTNKDFRILSDDGLVSTKYEFSEEMVPFDFHLSNSTYYVLGGINPEYTNGSIQYSQGILYRIRDGKSTEFSVVHNSSILQGGFISENAQFCIRTSDKIFFYDLP